MSNNISPTTPLVLIIFLDIDGVLLPFGRHHRATPLFPDSTLAALCHILSSFKEEEDHTTQACIVLSSTWRARSDFVDKIVEAFRIYNENTINSSLLPLKFYSTTSLENHTERQWEIHEWLEEHKVSTSNSTIRAWVALDDEELLEGKVNEQWRTEFEGHAVKTESSVGLTLQDAELAVTLLKRQMIE